MMEKFLVAVDCTPASLKCVRYLCRVLRGNPDFEVVLFHVLPTASPNLLKIEEVHRIEQLHSEHPDLSGYFWRAGDEEAMNRFFGEANRMLLDAGFEQSRIATHFGIQSTEISDLILAEAARLGCSTIVMGRRRLSRVKELLVGSVSGSVVRMARGTTVWVVDYQQI
jgi:nucleotide-binding universal stress UspA family protein